MTEPSVRFEPGEWYWVAERESVGFTGTTNLGVVEFLITNEALTQLHDPDLDMLDYETALEVFADFEGHIHRIAQREFVKRLGGEPPILLTTADVEG
ncbi:hypothetical protein ACFSGX_10735 [Sphingomonas arantia]|uniref:DUF1488 domain-containing protein n=1 Tax=Sphingomonas arantia TaxID=1460676 RepID=A0ABW4TWZ9_9SPHN